MADLLKNIGHTLTPNQLPRSQVLPSGPELVQYVENGPLNQTIAKMLTQNSAGVQEMLKGKFKFLGATEIVTGIISIIIGIVKMCIDSSRNRYFEFSLVIGTPWWTGVLFVIAGSLALAVEKAPTLPMIRGCISAHVISAISCLPATIIYAISIAIQPNCFYSDSCSNYKGTISCFAILLLLTLLNAAISIAVSSFNCKALNCCGTASVPIIVVYNNTSEQLVPSQPLYANTPP
ncbi:membrane-spanning 4-domains subfamily A member 4A-like isoform X1 [Rhincodon typus]|uniref:membrane-spanning 4-domains subfamily A member 4A-like isoform X1 n=1 Tax=Rhincodon typus TaxID=259920 RepID=UPI00202E57B3|nr:membrane-spanning 4-domains subfamily A member 4A-like isoform X1 [Rhincodon typus]